DRRDVADDLERQYHELGDYINATQNSAAVEALHKVKDQIMDAMYAAEMSGANLGGGEDHDLLHDTEWIRVKVEREKAKDDFEALLEQETQKNRVLPLRKAVVLIPTVTPEGKELTNEEAIEHYFETGHHLGVFRDRDSAEAYLHGIAQAEK